MRHCGRGNRPATLWTAFASGTRLLAHFVQREIRERFLGTVSGGTWLLIGPLLSLAAYLFVFAEVMRVRLHADAGDSFVVFLALGLWPWFAFSEAVLRGTTSIRQNAALIGKIALDRKALVQAAVIAAFVIHGIGFLLVLIVLASTGTALQWSGIGYVVLGLLGAGSTAYGLALGLSAAAVFLRDIESVLAQILMLGMLLTPIFFPPSQIPKQFAWFVDWNPLAVWIGCIRGGLLGRGLPEIESLLIASAVALVVLLIGAFVFRRASPHFEDYL